MTNRKSHTPFRLVPKSTTLDDLERPIRILLQKRCVFGSPPQKKWMKIDPYYQRQKCRPLTLVSGDIRFVPLFAGVLWRGGVKRQCGNWKRENVYFQGFGRYVFGTLGNEANIIIQWPQNIWPWMTLTGYLALNSVFAPVWLAETARVRKKLREN